MSDAQSPAPPPSAGQKGTSARPRPKPAEPPAVSEAPAAAKREEPADIARRLLAGRASEDAPTLMEVLRQVGDFAKISQLDRQVVLDRQAFLKAICAVGMAQSRKTVRLPNAATSLVARLLPGSRDLDATLAREAGSGAKVVSESLGAGFETALSSSIETAVVPVALDLARRTIGREQFDLRHLVLALLQSSGPEWSFLGQQPTPGELRSIRIGLVEDIARTPNPGEKIDLLMEFARGGPDTAPPPRTFEDRVAAQRDEPAKLDRLGRLPFARVLAQRLIEVRKAQVAASQDDDRAFVVHLDGPWGSGKSSVLNFITEELRAADPPWLVVNVNAWREEARQPA